jgi:hypothetical protein
MLLALLILWLSSSASGRFVTRLATFDSLRTDSSAPYVGLRLAADTATVRINGQPYLLRQRDSAVYNSLEFDSRDSSRYGLVVSSRILSVDSAFVTVEMQVQQYKKFRNWKIGASQKIPQVKLSRSVLSGYYFETSSPGRLSPRRRTLVICLALVALLAVVGISWYQSGSP